MLQEIQKLAITVQSIEIADIRRTEFEKEQSPDLCRDDNNLGEIIVVAKIEVAGEVYTLQYQQWEDGFRLENSINDHELPNMLCDHFDDDSIILQDIGDYLADYDALEAQCEQTFCSYVADQS